MTVYVEDYTLCLVCTRSCEYFSLRVYISGAPPSPVSAPVLHPSGEIAEFFVNLEYSAASTNDQEHPLTPVGVVYRIKDKSTLVTRYWAQVGDSCSVCIGT